MKKLLVLILVLGMAMPAIFVAPVAAAEWSLYGSARMSIGTYDRSKEWAKASDQFIASDGVNSDTDTLWFLQSNSRVGANVKASDAISGRFEYGASSGNANIRLLYGVWNFGMGKLVVGQDYTPIDTLLSNQIGATVLDGDDDMLKAGMTYEGRHPQIKFNIQGFELALIKPSTTIATSALSTGYLPGTTYTTPVTVTGSDGNDYTIAGGLSSAGTSVDTTLPKIEVAYTYATDLFSIHPYLGYNSVDAESAGVGQRSKSIDSMVYGLNFTVTPGPAFIKGNIVFATNPSNYGMLTLLPAFVGVNSAGSTEDADVWGGAILAGYKINDMFTVEAGFGTLKSEQKIDGVKGETDIKTYYVNCTINVAPGFFVVPEYGYWDQGDYKETGSAKTKLGDCSYFAAKLQINF